MYFCSEIKIKHLVYLEQLNINTQDNQQRLYLLFN